MIDRHHGHLACDGRDHAIRLLDAYHRSDEGNVHRADAAWMPQLHPVAAPGDVRAF